MKGRDEKKGSCLDFGELRRQAEEKEHRGQRQGLKIQGTLSQTSEKYKSSYLIGTRTEEKKKKPPLLQKTP